jgi:hypothetical protein
MTWCPEKFSESTVKIGVKRIKAQADTLLAGINGI